MKKHSQMQIIFLFLFVFIFTSCSLFIGDKNFAPENDLKIFLKKEIENGVKQIILPEGSFKINSTILLPDDIHLQGNLRGTTLVLSEEYSGPIITNSSWEKGNKNIKVSNIKFDGLSELHKISDNNYHKRAYAKSLSQVDNVAIYFKNVESAEISRSSFINFKNEAIFLSSSRNITVLSNDIRNCSQKAHVNDWAQGCIYLRHSNKCLISENHIKDCYEGGIVAGFDSHNNSIILNEVTNTPSGEGVFIGCGTENIVAFNKIHDTSKSDLGSGAGIALSVPPSIDKLKFPSNSYIIVHNQISSTGGSGISVYRSDNNLISFNSVTDVNLNQKSRRGGISIYESEKIIISNNKINVTNCPPIGIQKSKGISEIDNQIKK